MGRCERLSGPISSIPFLSAQTNPLRPPFERYKDMIKQLTQTETKAVNGGNAGVLAFIMPLGLVKVAADTAKQASSEASSDD